MKLSKEERRTIIELICDEQTHMIMKRPDSYTSTKYIKLEKLKIKIKDVKE